MSDSNERSLKLYCDKCNFQSKGPSQWLKHIESSKHNRNGEKKQKHVQYVIKLILIILH